MHKFLADLAIGDRVVTYNQMRGTIYDILEDEVDGEILIVRLDGHDGEYAYGLDEVHKLPGAGMMMPEKVTAIKKQVI